MPNKVGPQLDHHRFKHCNLLQMHMSYLTSKRTFSGFSTEQQIPTELNYKEARRLI